MKEAIEWAVKGRELPPEMMAAAVRAMMDGSAAEAQIGAFLSALSIKGETVGEISAAVGVLRELMTPQPLPDDDVWVDIVGTGGDGASFFNVSTAAALVASAGGVKIAKHGNVGVSSSSGSADVLRLAGLRLDLSPAQLRDCMAATGFGFMFAPNYHSAMRHVAPARRAIGIRTIFNILGPLANPARVRHQVLGVYSPALQEVYAAVGAQLGLERLLVVHAEDGLDELSVLAPSHLIELRAGQPKRFTLNPGDFGWHFTDPTPLRVANAEASLALVEQALQGTAPAVVSAMVALNAAALFYLTDREPDWAAGLRRAEELMRSGAALAHFRRVIQATKDITL